MGALAVAIETFVPPEEADVATHLVAVGAVVRIKAARVGPHGRAVRHHLVVDDEVLMDEALSLAARLANGPKSIGLMRKAYWTSFSNSFSEQFQLEANLQGIASSSDDNKEGVKAFLEKRPAEFTGN